MIKQEVHEDSDDNNIDTNSNDGSSVHDLTVNNNCQDVAHESAGLSPTIVALQQQTKHFRQQHEEIVNRLHKAVSDNLKLINQGTETGCNGSAFVSSSNKQQQQHHQQDGSSANHNMNLNMTLSSNGRFAVRNFNGNSSDMKLCRLNNKSKMNNAMHQQQQQLHVNVTNDLFSSLIDSSNDDNNNSNNDLILNDDNNADSNYLLPCPLCEIPLEPRLFRQHLDRHYPRDSPICPVLQCGRRFAHPNSVRNHMRLKHTVQWNRMKSMRSSGGPFSSLPY